LASSSLLFAGGCSTGQQSSIWLQEDIGGPGGSGKAVAERAKLDKENFWLHKFRATFATWALWAGVDLRSVQQWLGHSDMESTMRYLKPSRSQKVREKVNEIFA
jgi:integrase